MASPSGTQAATDPATAEPTWRPAEGEDSTHTLDGTEVQSREDEAFAEPTKPALQSQLNEEEEEQEEGEIISPSLSRPPSSPPSTTKDKADPEAAAAEPKDAPPPPLPSEPAPQPEDDGWDFQWDATSQAYFFYNRFTGQTTWENPRVSPREAQAAAAQPAAPGTTAPTTAAPAPLPPPPPPTVAGGYNPAIHGDYDPNAWYAKGAAGAGAADGADADSGGEAATATFSDGLVPPPGAPDHEHLYQSGGRHYFNRLTGQQHQRPDQGPQWHGDEAKSRRQLNAFFDVDAAANSHDGRSLKAERACKRLTKGELKAYKEKRKAKKEEKRRAWLRD